MTYFERSLQYHKDRINCLGHNEGKKCMRSKKTPLWEKCSHQLCSIRWHWLADALFDSCQVTITWISIRKSTVKLNTDSVCLGHPASNARSLQENSQSEWALFSPYNRKTYIIQRNPFDSLMSNAVNTKNGAPISKELRCSYPEDCIFLEYSHHWPLLQDENPLTHHHSWLCWDFLLLLDLPCKGIRQY